MLDTKVKERFEELENVAINCYLDKTDFSVGDWLDDEDLEEWKKLYKEYNGCCYECGEETKNCVCENVLADGHGNVLLP